MSIIIPIEIRLFTENAVNFSYDFVKSCCCIIDSSLIFFCVCCRIILKSINCVLKSCCFIDKSFTYVCLIKCIICAFSCIPICIVGSFCCTICDTFKNFIKLIFKCFNVILIILSVCFGFSLTLDRCKSILDCINLTLGILIKTCSIVCFSDLIFYILIIRIAK